MEVDFDAARARLRVRDLEVFDDHDFANSQTSGLGLPGDLGFPYPPIKPVFPVRATVSFEVEWSGLSDSANITNAQQGFNGLFLQTGSSIHWSVRQKGFRFQSDPSRSQSLFAVIGRERNGTFFSS